MQILVQAVRIIDYDRNRVQSRPVPQAFGEYVAQLIEYINANKSVREFTTQSAGTEVIGSILDIVNSLGREDIVTEKIDGIAGRLLQKEAQAQSRIGHMDVHVQKGSLLLALLKDGEAGGFRFLLAKVEHTEFFDDLDYSIKTGFSRETKKIWKTCLFEIDDVCAGQFDAKVYSNTAANYWWKDFLELKECQSDEVNTKRSFKALESVLNRSLKKDAPYDHMVIRNAMYQYFSSTSRFDFDEMLGQMLERYEPAHMSDGKKEELLQQLRKLPEEKQFDRQFIPVPAAIRPKMKKVYEVYNGIQLKIAEPVEELGDVIEAYREKNGEHYLKIRINNEDTYRIFEKKKDGREG